MNPRGHYGPSPKTSKRPASYLASQAARINLVGQGQSRDGIFSTTPAVNALILGSGLTLGFVAYRHRDKPIGTILLGSAGSMTATGLVLFLLDALKN